MPASTSSHLSRIVSGLAWLLMAALLLLVAAVQVVPWALSGKSMVVLTGSMEPTFRPGDIIAVKAASPAEVRVGDIVTFQPVSDDPTLITHRVVAKSVAANGKISFVTRGDANSADDDPIVAGQVKGAYLYRIPYLGWGLNALGGPGSGAVKVAAVALIAAAGWMLAGPRRRPARAAAAEADAPVEAPELVGSGVREGR